MAYGSKILIMEKVFYILFVLIFYSSCFDHSETKYCLPENDCVTLLKQTGGVAYVVAGSQNVKDKSLQSHIETNTTQSFTFYFAKEMPNKIIVRSQGNIDGENEFKIMNASEGTQFVQFDNDIRSLLYGIGKRKFNEVNEGVDYIDLSIKENYAKNKDGNFIK